MSIINRIAFASVLLCAALLLSSQPALAQFTQQGGKLVGTGVGFGVGLQGTSAALSADGNTAIVGGYRADSFNGAAWVYTRSGGGWTQQGNKLVGAGASQARQGLSVGVSADGNTAIVGGPDGNAAWVFTRSGVTWSEQQKLVGTGGVGAPRQGHSVALSADGNTAIVGGYGDNGNIGAAWVFTLIGGVWTQQDKLIGIGTVGNAFLGISVGVSADGNTAIVGGHFDNGGIGAAWVFIRSGGVWAQQDKLVGIGAVGNARQGSSVALSADGNTAIVGGPIDNGLIGAAWVYTRSGGVWGQSSKLVGAGAVFSAEQGTSVALAADGNTAIVGGPVDNGNGAAWVFTRSGGAWSQLDSKLVGIGNTGNASQGVSVALSGDGNTAIAGGNTDNSNAGAAWVFVQPPVVTSVTANSGTGAGGTAVTIAGTHLTGATGVTFGGAAATNVVVVDDTTVTATTPLHAVGAVDVIVNSEHGSGTETGAFTYTVASSTTLLGSSANPSTFGQSVTFTATVTAGATGTVTFKIDGTDQPDLGTVSAGTATFITSALSAGGHSVIAIYNGDTNYFGSTSSTLTQTVEALTTTSVGSSVNPSVFGQSVTFTANVTAGATGTVTFKDGVSTIGSDNVSIAGTAIFTTAALFAGSHSITAVYSGDASYATSTSSTLTQKVKALTTTSVGSSLNPSNSGQSVTFTATVTGGSSPGGTVTFKDDGTTIGSGSISGTTAIFVTSVLTAGSHSITAVYNGDTNYAGSTSSTLTQTVGKGATTSSVGSSDSTSTLGQSVQFTATIAVTSPATGTPTGTVTFKDGAATLGAGSLSGTTATFSTGSLAVGSHTITAVYAGDTNFTTSTSSGVTQTVNKGVTTTSVGASPNPSKPGQSVSFTATVAVTAPATGTPTGTITFKEGAMTLGTGMLSSGMATFMTSALTTGSHSVTARFAGTAGLAASMSSPVNLSVDPRVGPEFRVNTHTANTQQQPSVARLNSGFVVTWASNAQDGSGYGIYGQRYNAAGAKVPGEFRVNTATAGDQSQPSAARITTGFVVTWQSAGQDGSGLGVYGQRYSNTGAKAGIEFRVNTTTVKNQSQPSVAGLAGSGFVVAWTSDGQDSSGLGVYAQRFTSLGATAGSEFRVNTATANNQTQPSIAALTGGGFVVTWQSDAQDGSLLGIYGQRYDSAGTAAGKEFRVNTGIANAQSLPSAAGLNDGGFVVTWQSNAQDGSGLGIYGQRYRNTGAKAGVEFRVNTVTAMDQSQPSVTAFSDAGFVVTWTSAGQDGSGKGVYGQAYSAAGAKVDIEFRVNATTAKDQWQPSVAAFSGGSFVVVWTSRDQDGSLEGVYGQRFSIVGVEAAAAKMAEPLSSTK